MTNVIHHKVVVLKIKSIDFDISILYLCAGLYTASYLLSSYC